MNFSDLDKQMRVFETAHDHKVLPDMWLVARLDGRSFTVLTKSMGFTKPFDAAFRDAMVWTTNHLFGVGFKVLYGYTESDEISLLFGFGEQGFGRKLRKMNSVLAGEASAAMSLYLETLAVFDCRISQLPNRQRVVDYFRWRQADAERNGLNTTCYWLLRERKGYDKDNATFTLMDRSVPDKHDLLMQEFGINYNELPAWQKRGVGVYMERVPKQGFNPKTGETTVTTRNQLCADMELPFGDAYCRFVEHFVRE